MIKAVGSTGSGFSGMTRVILRVTAAALVFSALVFTGCGGGDNPVTAGYKITFNANGGSGTPPNSQSAGSGKSVTLPDQGSLTRSGYDFGGWNTKSDGTGTNYNAGSSYTLTASVTLYARWVQAGSVPPSIIPNEIKAQFENKMPIYTGTTPPDISGQYVASILELAGSSFSVDKIGEEYDDHYLAFIRRADGKLSYREKTGTSEIGSDDMLVGIIGSGDKFTAYFISTGTGTSSGVTIKESVIMSGTMTSGGIQNFHYAFIILEKNNDPQNQYMPVNSYRIFKDGDGLAEKYDWIGAPNTYKVTFSVNGGDGTAPASQTVNAGSSITLPNGSALTKSGYSFEGWNTKNDGTGTHYNAGASYKPASNVMLYAEWKEITAFTVTFNANGGSGTAPESITADSGSTVTLPSNSGIKRSGYAFDGWNTKNDGTGTNYSAGSSLTLKADATLYAKWTASALTGTFTDSRDGKTYKYTTIGEQVWMAENLNYDIPGVASDVCYNNDSAYCDTYGRLYSWTAAMSNLSASSENPSGIQGACPAGWHVPSNAEWGELYNYVGAFVGQRLRSSTGWNTSTVVGTDEFGFAALPGGYVSGSSSSYVGQNGYWWTTTADGANYAYNYRMYYGNSNLDRASSGLGFTISVRCVRD